MLFQIGLKKISRMEGIMKIKFGNYSSEMKLALAGIIPGALYAGYIVNI